MGATTAYPRRKAYQMNHISALFEVEPAQNAKGILFIQYFGKGKTINSEYYANLLQQFRQQIREERIGLDKKKILFN